MAKASTTSSASKSSKSKRSRKKNDLSKELEFAVKLALESAVIVRTFYVGAADIEYKNEDEPVTEADRSSNRHIIKRITEAFPDDAILSEEAEDDLARLDNDRVWIIDPLDGTKEFIARNGEFSIMIGLAIKGEAVLGAVMHPEPRLLYAGAKGHGAFLVEEGSEERFELTVSDTKDPREMLIVCSRSHRPKIVDQAARDLRISRERISGSVGIKAGLIARQLADFYPHAAPGCKEWDLCAPHALIEAAGGKMTDCWGQPITYNHADIRVHNGLVATNGKAHDKVIKAVAKACEAEGFNSEDGFW